MILFDNEDISDLCKDVDICTAPQRACFDRRDIIFNEFHDDGINRYRDIHAKIISNNV